MNRRRGVAVGAVVLSVLASVLWFLRIPGELERWKMALRSRGEKLTLAEVSPPFSPDVRAWEGSFNTAATQVLTGPLALGTIQLMRSNAPGRALASWQHADPFQLESTTDVWPEFRQQMEDSEPALAEIRALLANRPSGSTRDPANPFGQAGINFVMRRSVTYAFVGATVCHLHDGRIDAALTNLHALIALGKTMGDDSLVSRMIGVAIAKLGLWVTWEALQAPGWDEPRLASLQSAWQSLDLVRGMACMAVNERAMTLAWFEVARTNHEALIYRVPGTTPSLSEQIEVAITHPLWRSAWAEGDELLYLQAMQPMIEGLRIAETNANFADVQERWKQGRSLLDEHQGRLDEIRYQITSAAIPKWDRSCSMVWNHEALRRLAVIAIAMKRQQLAHGRAPAGLAELVPEWLPSVPADPMNGQTLKFRRESEESFSLYSVGVDGKDEGGAGDDVVWPGLALPDEPPVKP